MNLKTENRTSFRKKFERRAANRSNGGRSSAEKTRGSFHFGDMTRAYPRFGNSTAAITATPASKRVAVDFWARPWNLNSKSSIYPQGVSP
jgi:hypothetical protein